MYSQQYTPPVQGQGLPPEYSQQLFTNMQAQAAGQKRASDQQVMDNTSRNPAMSGVQQMLLNRNDQNLADQTLNQGRQAQLEGVNAARQDRLTQQQQQWQAGQNEANRQVDYAGQRNQVGMQKAGYENQQGNFWPQQLAGVAGGVAGMMLGPAGAAAGYGLGKSLYNNFNNDSNLPPPPDNAQGVPGGGYYSGGGGYYPGGR